MDNKQVILSYSGGMDSTSLLLYYLAQGAHVTAISFKYGQNHAEELKRASKIIKILQKLGYEESVSHHVVDLTSAFALSASALVASNDQDIPTGSYNEEDMKATVVENRNVIFSSIIYGMALGVSKRTGNEVIIAQGVHAGDHSLYPDTRPESIQAAQELYKISNWGSEKVTFETPFLEMTKGQVLERGILSMEDLGFNKPKMKKILKMTLSCYSPDHNGSSCGKCGTCQERLEAFAYAGKFMDPATYANPALAQETYASLFEKYHPNRKVRM